MSTVQRDVAQVRDKPEQPNDPPAPNARRPIETPLVGQSQLRLLLSGRLRVLIPLLIKCSEVAAAKFYMRKCQHVGHYVRSPGKPLVFNKGYMEVGDRVIIQSTTVRSELVAHPGGRLEIGDRTWIGYGCSLSAHLLVRIGADCHLGPYTNILDNDYHDIEDHRVTPPSRPVEIGDNVWIGTRVIILPGVTIGEGAVIGAGAVVTKSVPPRAVAAGNPARIIRTIS